MPTFSEPCYGNSLPERDTASRPKRFYTNVRREQVEGFWQILLDARALKTPAQRLVKSDNENIADILCQEWRAQKEYIDPQTMPMTRLVNSAIDAVPSRRCEVIESIVDFFTMDSLLYRALEPLALLERQNAAWNPVLDWCERRFSVHLKTVTGVVATPSLEKITHERLKTALLTPSPGDLQLAALHVITSLTGSALLALALRERFCEAEDIWRLAHIDEDWNREKWGSDAEALRIDRLRHADFCAAAYALLGDKAM